MTAFEKASLLLLVFHIIDSTKHFFLYQFGLQAD